MHFSVHKDKKAIIFLLANPIFCLFNEAEKAQYQQLFSNAVNILLLFMSDALKCLNIGTPKTINFPFVPNGKLMILSVPIFEHIIILG